MELRAQTVRYCSQTCTMESITPLIVCLVGKDIVVSGSKMEKRGNKRGLRTGYLHYFIINTMNKIHLNDDMK